MTHKTKWKINKQDLEYYKKLLDFEFTCDNEDNDLGAIQDDYIYITTLTFDNGNYITIDLASGHDNYYDNIVLWDKDGNELSVSDCGFDLSSFSMFYEEDIYDVELEVEE